MTFKLRYIDMQILIQHFRRQLQISVHKKFSTEMQKQKKIQFCMQRQSVQIFSGVILFIIYSG